MLNYLGFLKQPESQEEAQTYADRREQVNAFNESMEDAKERTIEKTEYVPLIGTSVRLSDAMMKKDATKVITGTIFFAMDATGGGGGVQKLTNGGKKVLGNLVDMADMALSEGVLKRGGKIGNLGVIDTALKSMKISEVANMAAQGNQKAQTAIKILKQASSKAQKY